MNNLILVRHGERTDEGMRSRLTAEGREKISRLGKILLEGKTISGGRELGNDLMIFSSPMLWMIQSMDLLAEILLGEGSGCKTTPSLKMEARVDDDWQILLSLIRKQASHCSTLIIGAHEDTANIFPFFLAERYLSMGQEEISPSWYQTVDYGQAKFIDCIAKTCCLIVP